MSFSTPLVICLIVAFFCVGFYLYARRRKYILDKIKARNEAAAGRRPPTTNHHVINMPTNLRTANVPYHGQTYPISNNNNPSSSSTAYDQPPPFKPDEEIALPPPAYNEHKNDVRLPAAV